MKILVDEINQMSAEEKFLTAKSIIDYVVSIYLTIDARTTRLEINSPSLVEALMPEFTNANIEQVKSKLPETLKKSIVFIFNGMVFVENKELELGTIRPL